jgi:hypothetical protein
MCERAAMMTQNDLVVVGIDVAKQGNRVKRFVTND